jgi:hypothetical protein
MRRADTTALVRAALERAGELDALDSKAVIGAGLRFDAVCEDDGTG